MKTLNDYKLSECIFSNHDYSEFLADEIQSNRACRLVRFSFEVSSKELFRAQLRRDVELLRSIRHFNILPVLDWGESDGTFFCVSELPEGSSIAEHSDHHLSWDQVTDVAWQLSSAIQHAHNAGLTHGQLDDTCVFVSPELRVQVGRFGQGTWIGASTEEHLDEVIRRESDVRQLGQVLRSFLDQNAEFSGHNEFAELRQIVDETRASPLLLTARDLQRRLGELLMRDTDDEISMIDDRAGQSLTGRSLVDELFDDVDSPARILNRQPSDRLTPSIVIEIVCIVALLVLLAVGIWLAMA